MMREDLEPLVCSSASNQKKYERNYLIFKVLKKKVDLRKSYSESWELELTVQMSGSRGLKYEYENMQKVKGLWNRKSSASKLLEC